MLGMNADKVARLDEKEIENGEVPYMYRVKSSVMELVPGARNDGFEEAIARRRARWMRTRRIMAVSSQCNVWLCHLARRIVVETESEEKQVARMIAKRH